MLRELCTRFTKRKNRVQISKKTAFSQQKIAKKYNRSMFCQFLMLMNLSILVVQSSQIMKQRACEGSKVVIAAQEEGRFGRINTRNKCWCVKPHRPRVGKQHVRQRV